MKQVYILIRKEALIEWRTLHTFVGVMLYVACTVFALYMMLGQPEAKLWNALFWIAQLFVTVNAVAKSFIQENLSRTRYYYTLVAPWKFILGKIVYNLLFILFLSTVSFFAFRMLLGDVVSDALSFYWVMILGTGTLSVLFTFLSAIAAQAQQGAAMTAILGFPIAIPLILLISNVSVASATQVAVEGYRNMLLIIAGLEVMIVALALVLFPFLWNE